MTNEILTCIKVRPGPAFCCKNMCPWLYFTIAFLCSYQLIKTYAWEIPFGNRIADIRKKERVNLQRAGYMQSVTVSLVPTLPALASVATFLVHAFAVGTLEPDKVRRRTADSNLRTNIEMVSFFTFPLLPFAGLHCASAIQRAPLFTRSATNGQDRPHWIISFSSPSTLSLMTPAARFHLPFSLRASNRRQRPESAWSAFGAS